MGLIEYMLTSRPKEEKPMEDTQKKITEPAVDRIEEIRTRHQNELNALINEIRQAERQRIEEQPQPKKINKSTRRAFAVQCTPEEEARFQRIITQLRLRHDWPLRPPSLCRMFILYCMNNIDHINLSAYWQDEVKRLKEVATKRGYETARTKQKQRFDQLEL